MTVVGHVGSQRSHGDFSNATVEPLVGVETPEGFMRGAVQAVERLTRTQGVWVERRKSHRDRPFTQGDDALSDETQ